MEKNIKLKMGSDKVLRIFLNNDEKYIISANDRTITAEKIYEIVEFSIGDHYSLSSENENNIDKPVLDFFAELFQQIIDKVNALSANEQDDLIV